MDSNLFLSVITAFLLYFPLSAENPEILEIREFYYNLSDLINNEGLYRREATVSYNVIPGIGTPVSNLITYYDMIFDDTVHEYDIFTLKIINTYQFAGNVSYEEYVFNYNRKLIFVFTNKIFIIRLSTAY